MANDDGVFSTGLRSRTYKETLFLTLSRHPALDAGLGYLNPSNKKPSPVSSTGRRCWGCALSTFFGRKEFENCSSKADITQAISAQNVLKKPSDS